MNAGCRFCKLTNGVRKNFDLTYSDVSKVALTRVNIDENDDNGR